MRLTRRAAVAAAASTAAISAAACAMGGSAGGASPSGPPTPVAATVSWLHWTPPTQPFGKPLAEAIDRLRERQPRLDVQQIVVPNAEVASKLQTLAAAGTPPDVSGIRPWDFVGHERLGLLRPLDQLASRDAKSWDRNDIWPAALQRVIRNGKLSGLPLDLNVSVLLYNQELLSGSGAPVPTDAWTWDDLLNAAKRATRGDGDAKQFGINAPGAVFGWIPILWGAGGDLFAKDLKSSTIAQPPGVETLQWLADLRFRHQVAPTVQEQSAAGGEAGLFNNGRIAYRFSDTAGVANARDMAKFRWDAAFLPTGRAGRLSLLRGASVGMVQPAKQADAAWLVMQALTDKDAQTGLARVGFIPARKSAAGPFQVSPPENIKKAMDMINFGRDFQYIERETDLEQAVAEEVRPLFDTNQKSAREVAESLRVRLDSLVR
jgi:multiple sugar transport system substrate-binding protein